LYLFGGDPYSGRGPDSWYYDLVSDAWTAVSPMPVRMVAGSAITLDDYIYLIGGMSHSAGDAFYQGEVQRYDPQQDEWEVVSSMPVVVYHCALAVLEGEIYVIGGQDASNDYDLVQIYNPETNAWREGPPLQRGKAGHAAVVVDGMIYVLGGERVNSEDFSVLDSVEGYDPAAESWSYGVPMPIGLHGVPAAAIEGTIFVVGGSEQANGVSNHGYLLSFRPE
jgi:N-acetylneuraminic acid mutarotase